MATMNQVTKLNPLRYHISKRFLKVRHPFAFPGPTYEERNRRALEAHRGKQLELADRLEDKPQQFKVKPLPPDPIIKTIERKLNPLHEEMPNYNHLSESDIKSYEGFGDYYDPLFNPHLHENKNKVNPHEEPFNAIYRDSASGLASEFTKVRNIATPELWEYVESLARIKVAPQPPTRKAGENTPLPSGFVPPPETPPDLPYFIPRTRNYLLPVYYRLHSDPEECFTYINKVTGDLWQLEQELREHLEKLQDDGQQILSSVQETDGQVAFRGRHIRSIVDWLHEKGF